MRFQGLQPTSRLSSLRQTQEPILSSSGLTEAADSVHHFLSSLSSLLLAVFLTEEEHPLQD